MRFEAVNGQGTSMMQIPRVFEINPRVSCGTTVARAYGFPEDISEEEALARLFEMNQEWAGR